MTSKWSNMTDWDSLAGMQQMLEPMEFIGHQKVREQIQPFLHQGKFPHTLITGMPGTGKSHLARWIATQRKSYFAEFFAPIRKKDLPTYGVVLLDEIHLQKRPEWLFPIMEGSGPTIIGATKAPEKMDDAFARRFLLKLKLTKYSVDDMKEMVGWYANEELTDEQTELYARASAGNPDQLLRIIRTAEGLETYDPEVVLSAVRINGDGLTIDHMVLLKQLSDIGRPVGVNYLATAMYTSEEAVKRLESLLLDMQLIELTPKGRDLTTKGSAYIGILRYQGLV